MRETLATTHPHLAAEWHPTKNGNLTPRDVVAGSHKKVWWKCNKGTWLNGDYADDHEWKTSMNSRTSNKKEKGCPCCVNQKVVPSNCLAATHPHLAAEWHPTKNGNLTPRDVVAGSKIVIWWKCNKGTWPNGDYADDHEWEAVVYCRSENGCPCCVNQKVVPSNCLATTHPHLAAEWHPTKNGNLTTRDVVAGSYKKVWWKCDKGTWPNGDYADDHEWEAVVFKRTQGRTCPCCLKRRVVPSNCLATTHPHLVAEWHPTKNGNLTPRDVVAGSEKKRWWKCDKCNHEWDAIIKNRTSCRAAGCPRCNESKGEKAVVAHLESLGFVRDKDFLCQYITKTDRPDFIIPKLKCFIEVNGRQHYIPVDFGSKKKYAALHNLIRNIRSDNKKLQRSIIKGWPLLTIPYWNFDRIPEILNDMLAGKTPTFSDSPEIVKKYEPTRKKIRDRLGIKGPEILCGWIK